MQLRANKIATVEVDISMPYTNSLIRNADKNVQYHNICTVL